MPDKSTLTLFAQYNQLMNEKVYAAAKSLGTPIVTNDYNAFFRSILGTLNHILVADIIWLTRFANHPAQFRALNIIADFPKPTSLDQIIYDDLEKLEESRASLDAAIIEFIHELKSEHLTSNLTYHNTKGASFTKAFLHLLHHFFNHQTHHRGQVTTLLSQHSTDIGSTDLLQVLPNI
ncbi:DinB family protein [Aurantivibrio plasticivorans]